jgi:hypothetical protein
MFKKKLAFLKLFPNMTISRKGEKRIPLVESSQRDPKNFFCCDPKWQVCTFDFTFRDVNSDQLIFKAMKFNVIDGFYYGENEGLKEHGRRSEKYEDLILYRGPHLCQSKSFTFFLPRLFNGTDESAKDLMAIKVLQHHKFKDFISQ